MAKPSTQVTQVVWSIHVRHDYWQQSNPGGHVVHQQGQRQARQLGSRQRSALMKTRQLKNAKDCAIIFGIIIINYVLLQLAVLDELRKYRVPYQHGVSNVRCCQLVLLFYQKLTYHYKHHTCVLLIADYNKLTFEMSHDNLRQPRQNQPVPKYIMLPTSHYLQMKQLIQSLSSLAESFTVTCSRSSSLEQLMLLYSQQTQMLQELYGQINEEFNEGKINKRVLETQIEAGQDNAKEISTKYQQKEKEVVKYVSQLSKVSQQNEKLRQYIRKMKQDNKNYKAQMEELVQMLSTKVKKYKSKFEDKESAYKAKIRYLETKVQKADSIGHDLDKELEELAKMEAQAGYQSSDTQQ